MSRSDSSGLDDGAADRAGATSPSRGGRSDSFTADRELAPVTQHAQLHGRSRRTRRNLVNQLIVVRRPASPVEADDDVVGADAGALGRRSFGHVLHDRALLDTGMCSDCCRSMSMSRSATPM